MTGRIGLFLFIYLIQIDAPTSNNTLLASQLNLSGCEDDDHPHEPPKQKKQMPKRKRSLSYQPRSVSNQKRAKPASVNATASIPDPQVLDDPGLANQLSCRGAGSTVSNSTLKSNLKSLHKQLTAASSSLAEKDKQIERLNKKNQDLTRAVKNSRQAARDTKTTSSAEVKQALTELKQAQDQIQKLQVIIDEKESVMSEEHRQYDSKMMKAVSDAVEKEKVTELFLICTSKSILHHNTYIL